jgi:sortase A
MASRTKGFSMLERGLLTMGICFLIVDAAALLHQAAASRLALRDFDRARVAAQAAAVTPPPQLPGVEHPDFREWAPSRVRAYRKSRLQSAPLAVLRIDKVKMRVPVFEGTDELVLNRGAGWIPGTARPGQSGNVGIAGHRDGFFRPLRNVSSGDTIEFSTAERTEIYTVDQIEIVKPDNVGVLRPRAANSLTLVTCYPFNFIGSAPLRYIVHARFQEPGTPPGSSKEVRLGEPDNSTKRREGK